MTGNLNSFCHLFHELLHCDNDEDGGEDADRGRRVAAMRRVVAAAESAEAVQSEVAVLFLRPFGDAAAAAAAAPPSRSASESVGGLVLGSAWEYDRIIPIRRF